MTMSELPDVAPFMKAASHTLSKLGKPSDLQIVPNNDGSASK